MEKLFEELYSELGSYQSDTLLNEVFSHADYTPVKYSWSLKIIKQLSCVLLYDNVYRYLFNSFFDTFKQVFLIFTIPDNLENPEKLSRKIIRHLSIEMGNESFEYCWSIENLRKNKSMISGGYLIIPLEWFYDFTPSDGFPLFACRKCQLSITCEYNKEAIEGFELKHPRVLCNYKKKTEREISSITCKTIFYKIPSEIFLKTIIG